MEKTDGTSFPDQIRMFAADLGFDLCGIARARRLDEYEQYLSSWLQKGMNDKMGYLARNIGKRLDPASLLEDVRSLIITGLGYYSPLMQEDPDAPVLSRYAYGTNYHDVITEKLEKLLDRLKRLNPEIRGRIVVDSAPLLEKAWAHEAGLGWQGKHSVLINRKIGSFFFIGTLLINIELEPDEPSVSDYCGDCRLCIEACPTAAINENRTIDARKCIANLTIENRGPIPEDMIPKLGRRVYGCDKCQEVCPWNRHAEQCKTAEFRISEEIASLKLNEWLNLTEDQFDRIFRKTAAERVGYDNFLRNVRAVTGN